ncbi:MAG: TlpA family protein disulfide reductase [Clostridiales bacterium]|nr:TlpA family protein disulfide reductase [Clostridiales bacterium]
MKKIGIVILVVTMMLVGCQSKTEESNIKDETSAEIAEDNTTDSSNDEIGNDNINEKNPVAGQVLKDISTTDIEGNIIDETIFNGHKITVLNLWATWCGPCVEEMPEFEEVSKTYKTEDVQFLGLIIDSEDDEVKDLLKQLGITYPQIKSDEKLKKQIVNHFDYVPVTLFIDENGKILEKFVPGGTTKEALEKMLDGMLSEK